MSATSAQADAFVRRQGLWSRLTAIFRTDRPTEEQLGQVSTVAEVAIDQVFSAYSLTEEQCRERHGLVKDYAECASLYGWVLGYHQGIAEGKRLAAQEAMAA